MRGLLPLILFICLLYFLEANIAHEESPHRTTPLTVAKGWMKEPAKCYIGHYLNTTTNACHKCPHLCDLCTGATKCDKNGCMENMVAKEVGCEPEKDCVKGQYSSYITGSCEDCPMGCAKCSDNQRCEECLPNYYLETVGLQQYCYPLCPEGTYWKDDKCIKCPPDCAKCVYNEANSVVNCLECANYFLHEWDQGGMPRSDCVLRCPNSTDYAADTRYPMRCILIPRSKRSPTDNSKAHTDMVKGLRHFTKATKKQSGVKCEAVPQSPKGCGCGTFLVSDRCLPCPTNCLKCEGTRNGTIIPPELVNSNEPLISSEFEITCKVWNTPRIMTFCKKDEKNVYFEDDGACMPCHSQCDEDFGCVGPSASHCLKCKGYRIFGTCVKKCPKHTYPYDPDCDSDDDCMQIPENFHKNMKLKQCLFHKLIVEVPEEKVRPYEHDAAFYTVLGILLFIHLLVGVGVCVVILVIPKKTGADDDFIILNWKNEEVLMQKKQDEMQQMRDIVAGSGGEVVGAGGINQVLVKRKRVRVKKRAKTGRQRGNKNEQGVNSAAILQPTQFDEEDEDFVFSNPTQTNSVLTERTANNRGSQIGNANGDDEQVYQRTAMGTVDVSIDVNKQASKEQIVKKTPSSETHGGSGKPTTTHTQENKPSTVDSQRQNMKSKNLKPSTLSQRTQKSMSVSGSKKTRTLKTLRSRTPAPASAMQPTAMSYVHSASGSATKSQEHKRNVESMERNVEM